MKEKYPMAVQIGNHMRTTAHPSKREEIQAFYAGLLGCKMLNVPHPNMDLFHFASDTFLGIYYDSASLSEQEFMKATWLELKTDDAKALKETLLINGIKQFEYPDKEHFYFQAPGGQVYRLASLG